MQKPEIFDYEYDMWNSCLRRPSHTALVNIDFVIDYVPEWHMFSSTKDYFIDIYGFRFRRSDGINTEDNRIYIDLSSLLIIHNGLNDV